MRRVSARAFYRVRRKYLSRSAKTSMFIVALAFTAVAVVMLLKTVN